MTFNIRKEASYNVASPNAKKCRPGDTIRPFMGIGSIVMPVLA